MINLDDISQENKKILDIYTLNNSRKAKNQVFIPFTKEDDSMVQKEVLRENKEGPTNKELSSFVTKMFDKSEVVSENKQLKEKKKNKINVDIEAFLQGEYDKFMEITPKNHLKKPEPVPFIKKDIKTDTGKIPTANNKVPVNNSDMDLNSFLKSQSNFFNNKSSLSKETIELIREVYDYLFDTLETFSAVYDNYVTVFENIETVKTFQPVKKPSTIDVRSFLLKYRKNDQLLMKLNMIALAIGNYNLHLIVDNYKNSTAFVNTPKNEFLKSLEMKYNGSEYDLAYLKEFLKVVRGDLSGQYIFEELSDKKPVEKVEHNLQNKKEPLKKKSLFNKK